MKILERIFRKKKSCVIIPSKMGLPSMKICGVVLVDMGLPPPCTFDTCVADGGGTGQAFLDPQKQKDNSNQKVSSIIFKSALQNLKNSLVNFDGVINVSFGNVVFEGGESEATKIEFDLNKIDLRTLIQVYSTCDADHAVFCPPDQVNEVRSILSNFSNPMPLFNLVIFSS
jgi:hypothetical protein